MNQMADGIISSVQNPKIKSLLALQQKSSERRKAGLFVVEGQRELSHCIEAGMEVDTIFYCPQLQLSTSSDNALRVESIHAVRGAYEVSVVPPHPVRMGRVTSIHRIRH